MASPAAALPPDCEPVPPPPDPVAIRACLTPEVAVVFDAEWTIVLDQTKQAKDLAGVHATAGEVAALRLRRAERPW